MSHVARNTTAYSFGNLTLAAHEEIISFEVDVLGGGFESISSLPQGWSIAIDNKSETETSINADLSFSSGALSLDQLKSVVVTISQAGAASQKLTLLGHLIVSNLGSERRVPLSGKNFLVH